MDRKSTGKRQLKSETAESEWYSTAEGRSQTQREFERALRTGSLFRSLGLKIGKSDPKLLQELMERAKENTTRAISIRIPVADLERARRIADEAGVGYQAILKQAIREGLKKAV